MCNDAAVLMVGLTGGIGAGKSTVAARLAALGAVVIDSDRLAREVVEPGTPGLAAVVGEFGPDVLLPDGTLDRPALGARVFAEPEARLRLNAILHPRIAARTGEMVAAAPQDAVVVHDVPLLVENGLADGYHLVIVVDAPQPLRVRRLVADRGMDSAEAAARMAAQAGDAARRAVADVWLDNAGEPGLVRAAVDRLWERRLVPFELGVRLRRPAPRPETVAVVEADPTWPTQAARLIGRVARASGSAALRVDHTGSTAVPGLAARDVVDLQVVVPDLATADALREALEDAGFARLGGQWCDQASDGQLLPKRVHTACDPGRPLTLHLRAVDGPSWREQLLFRDWLRAHAPERDAYAAAKRAAAGVDIDAYLDRKGPWIRAALERAAGWGAASAWAPADPEVSMTG